MKKNKKYYFELPKDFLSKWIKALRSGEYIQGQGKLCSLYDDTVEHCCLGVAEAMYHNNDMKVNEALTCHYQLDTRIYNYSNNINSLIPKKAWNALYLVPGNPEANILPQILIEFNDMGFKKNESFNSFNDKIERALDIKDLSEIGIELDGKTKSFNEIADWLETYVKPV